VRRLQPGTVLVLVLVLVLALALVLAGCAADEDDRAASTSSTSGPPVCEAEVPTTSEVSVSVIGAPTFVDGASSPALFAGGHDHAAGPVEPGEAHIHECFVVANGGADGLVVQAIQVLPASGEEAYALYEAEVLAEEFGVGAPEDDVVAAGESVALELLAPVDPASPPDAIRHRVAYTVMRADGRQDLFVEGEVVEVQP
jgi:hypothetical protein